MKKILFGLCLVAMVGLFSACTSKDQVNVTRVDEELFPTIHDESMTASLDAVPFSVQLPAGWTFREETALYTLVFDDGASGYIQVLKNPLKEWPSGYATMESGEGVSMACRSDDEKKYCAVRVGEGAVYSMVVTWKTMDATRRAEAEGILESVRAD
jgi:hypothetical protein